MPYIATVVPSLFHYNRLPYEHYERIQSEPSHTNITTAQNISKAYMDAILEKLKNESNWNKIKKNFNLDFVSFYPNDKPGCSITIKDVRFSPPATIVFWSDNTKTVVKAQNGEPFDAEKGLMACIIKRITGNTGRYNELFKKYIKEDK